MRLERTILRRITAAVTVMALLGGCTDFLTVKNPNVINESAIDPTADAVTLAASAQQNFAAAFGWHAMYQSWFTGETLVAETFPTRNEYARRDVVNTNASHNADVWGPISTAIASATQLLELDLPNRASNLNIARAAAFKGHGVLLMAEEFCTGVIRGGGPLTTSQMLDSAVTAFELAINVGTANGTPAGVELANLARVGLARAHLQAGRKAQAVTAAQAVPAGFVFNLVYFDDVAQRNRLGNRLWQFTLDRGSISVAPAYRIAGDPRIKFKAPAAHNLAAQDPTSGPFFIQDKFPAFNSPIRLASRLEADYIVAEASDVTAQLALINARRAANGLPVYAGATTAGAILTELMEQRGREFYLEAKRMGDFRRNPTAVLNVPVAGAAYFKAGFAPIGSQTCWPLPLQETDNNPNFPRS